MHPQLKSQWLHQKPYARLDDHDADHRHSADRRVGEGSSVLAEARAWARGMASGRLSASESLLETVKAGSNGGAIQEGSGQR